MPSPRRPSEAAAGSTISVTELEHMLKERDEGSRDFVLVDVREQNEYEINKIPGSVLIPKGEFLNGNALEQLTQDKPVGAATARPGCARPRRWRCSRAPVSPTRCTWAAESLRGSTRSTRRSRRTEFRDPAGGE